MTIKFEQKFKMQDFFDTNNEYHLFIISFATARQDLNCINKHIVNMLEGNENNELYFYLKLNIAYLCESYNLIKNAFEKDIKIDLLRIDGVKKLYDELEDLFNSNTIIKKILRKSRNNFFHYNYGYTPKDGKIDFERTITTLQNMYLEKFSSSYQIGNTNGENNYNFAEDIQMNWFFILGEKNSLTTTELIDELAKVTVKMLDLFTIIVNDFLINKVNNNLGYKIRYI